MAMTAQVATETALEISGLTKKFGDVTVLDSIDVSMAPGEFLVLVGPSGCGKSTLLNCIAGLEDASGGSISIAGRPVTQTPPRDRDIAMVFQSYALYPTMSVADNIGFGMKIRGMSKVQIGSRVKDVAGLLQIDHLLDRRPSQLSGGQRQRVAMGRALVRKPSLFLFDEPLSNLDAKLRTEMRAEIKRLHQTTGTSMVYVTHDQIEAMTLATKIVVLKGGRIQQVGTPEDIYDRPANCFVADFMGSPPMNLIPARLEQGGTVIVFDDGQRLTAPALPEKVRVQSNIILGVRPEGFSPLADVRNSIEIVPNMIENAGADAFVTFTIGNTKATARFPGRFRGEVETKMALAVDLSAACYFHPDDETLMS